MEVAGLFLGIAGLYAVCTEILDQFDSYRDFGISSSQLAARFEAEKLRLREWADVAGIQGGMLMEDHHRRLDDLAVRAIVYQILHSIVDLFPRAEQTLSDIRGKPVRKGSRDNRGPHIGSASIKVSRKVRVKWAFGNEARFTRQIESFELLTSKLYDLVPLNLFLDSEDAAAVAQSELSSKLHSAMLHTSNRFLGTSIKDIQLFSDVHKSLNSLLETNRSKVLAEDRRAAFDFLKPPNISEDFDNSLSKCLPGTCEWIFSLPVFNSWIGPSSIASTRLLWLNGTAGSGKSVLCSRVVSHLRTLPNIRYFYFFCTTHVQAGGKLEDIIRAWLFEMVKVDQSCLEVIAETMFQVEMSMSSFNLWGIFEKLVTRLGSCVFVIDGLDEFNKIDNQRHTFIGNLKRNLAWTRSRILITSRDEVDLRRSIEEPEERVDIVLYKISQTDTEADVNLFSKEIVKQKLGTKDKEFQAELAATLAGRSEGMFLWIALSGKYLRGGLSKARILQTIRNVPDGLLSAYARSWKFILDQPEYEKSRALDILGWCVSSIRPLTIAELTVALVINSDHNNPIDMTDLPDEIDDEYVNGEIIDLCSSLVETRSSPENDSIAKRTVHIVHFSVKDFLASAAELKYYKNEAESQLELARKCLWYLCHEDIKKDSSEAATAFYEYALNHWHLHLNLSKLKDDSFDQLIIKFFTLHESVFLEWTSIYEEKLSSLFNASSTTVQPSPIYFAASLDLTGPMQSLIQAGNINLNIVGGKLGTPLHAACYYGHIQAVKLLINSSVDIDNTEGLYGTPLHIATEENHPELVKVLVEHKALLDLRSESGQTSVFMASANGSDDMIRCFLDNHADISIAEVGGWTPLHIAAINGYLSTVKMLLEAGAEMTPLPDNQTPLHSAALKGHLSIVRTLMDRGATHLTATTTGWTPLHSACQEQRVEVVKFLLTLSTEDINKVEQDGYAPVNTVAELGNFEIVKMLIDSGADVTIASDEGFTPLHNASWRGHLPIVQLLLERDRSLISVTNKFGCTPIYSAAQGGQFDTLAFLLSRWPEMIDITCGNWTPLNAAAMLGYSECVELLLDHGAAINIPQEDSQTPLYSAASTGQVDIVRTLLKYGADATITLKNGSDALMTASLKGGLDIAKLLVSEAGLDVSAVANDGAGALHLAALSGHLDIVQYLIEQGADATASTITGSTVLHNGIRCGNVRLVKFLLDNGADSCLSNVEGTGNNPLHLASILGHLQILELLIDRGADMNVQNGVGTTSLNLAAIEGKLDVVQFFLSKGADMRPNDEQQTPLNNAAFHGRTEIVEILLDHGAEINVVNRTDWTPLHAACVGNHITTVKLLLDRGADLHIPNKNGAFPLHTAAGHDTPALTKLLVDGGAKVDQITVDGIHTPLMFAARKNHIEIVQYLFDSGADIKFSNNTGLTALHIASQEGATEIVKFLLEHGIPHDVAAAGDYNSTPLYYASEWGHTDIVSVLLEAGADPNRSCDDGWTPIIAAADKDHLELARVLLKHHADLNHLSNAGSSTVLRASMNGHLEMVRFLVDAGANPELPDEEGNRALTFAASRGHVSVVEFLISSGVEISSRNKYGQSALLVACYWNQSESIKALLSHGADVNISDYRKDTPLVTVLALKQVDIAWIMLDHGANMDIIDDQNRLCLHWAAKTGSLDIVRKVFEATFWTVSGNRKSRRRKSETRQANRVHWDLKEGSITAGMEKTINTHRKRLSDQPNAKLLTDQHCDNEGRSPLHFAAVSGSIACVEYLVSKGYDLDVLDIRGRSVLDYGCMSSSVKMVAWISRRIRGRRSDQTSWSSLHWACRTGDFLLIKHLYDMGIRSTATHIKDLSGSWLPLDVARYNRNDLIISNSGSLTDEPWHEIKDDQMFEDSTDPRVTPVFGNSLEAQGSPFGGYCDGCFFVRVYFMVQLLANRRSHSSALDSIVQIVLTLTIA